MTLCNGGTVFASEFRTSPALAPGTGGRYDGAECVSAASAPVGGASVGGASIGGGFQAGGGSEGWGRLRFDRPRRGHSLLNRSRPA
ncbi:hypothetical protein [Leifsonia poae]|uniref:hypothetical protein n=1 Tax=Leifsonia poae TaxID=110933 RepID=UPI001CBDFE4B|nr:hypothetical protein [Leifsonia poae]